MEKTGSVTAGNKAKRNGTSFSKEKPRPGPGRGKKKPVQEAGEKVVLDMERGYSTPEQPDDPPAVKNFRKLAHEDIGKFMALYLKTKEMAGHGEPVEIVEVAAAATGPVGVKEEAIEELAMRLLDEWGTEEGNSDAGRGESQDDSSERG